MSKQTEVNSVDGLSTLYLNMGAKVVQSTYELGIRDTVRSGSGTDFNTRTLTGSQLRKLLGRKYLGPSPKEIQDPFGFLADPARAEHRRSAYSNHLVRINDRHIAAARAINLSSPFSLFIYGHAVGHSRPAEEMLRDRQLRLPDEIRLGFSLLAHEQYIREGFRDPLLALLLKEEYLLECTVLADNLSKIVQNYGRPFQDILIAKALASLMAAIWHSPNQKGPADVAHALGRFAALVGLSFGVRHLLPDPKLGWYEPISYIIGGGSRGKGSLDDAIIQTRGAAEDALNNPDWRAIDEQIDPRKQAFMTLTLPITLADLPRWRPLISEVEHWFDNNYPYVLPLWAFGPGTPRPDLGSRSPYWIQATLFFPMPDEPRPIREIRQSPSLMRRNGKQSPDADNPLQDTKKLATSSGKAAKT